MKPIEFLGDSLKSISDFPREARQQAGYQLRTVQEGKLPEDFKSRSDIGKGVEEIRVWASSGTYGISPSDTAILIFVQGGDFLRKIAT